jgi:hypothetical protein
MASIDGREVRMGREEPENAGERALLVASLDGARNAVAATLIDVPVALLREPLMSPGSSLLGVIKHLTLLERRWFAYTFAGLDVALEDIEGASRIGWPLERSDTARTVMARYRGESQRSREIVSGSGLDEMAARPTPGGRVVVLRWVLLHMIEQTNRHVGHAHVLRELIDGATGESPWSSLPAQPPSPDVRSP